MPLSYLQGAALSHFTLRDTAAFQPVCVGRLNTPRMGSILCPRLKHMFLFETTIFKNVYILTCQRLIFRRYREPASRKLRAEPWRHNITQKYIEQPPDGNRIHTHKRYIQRPPDGNNIHTSNDVTTYTKTNLQFFIHFIYFYFLITRRWHFEF